MSTEPENYQDNFFEYHLKGAISSAEAVIPIVSQYMNPASVIDIGCGIGAWLSIWKKSGVKEIMGIDGDYVDISKLLIEKSEFKARDLEKDFTFNKKYELVTCLEVAEHLHKEFAQSFIHNLSMLGDVILFSAAVPGQGGTQHWNEQYPEYWANLFESNGFIPIDSIRLKIWNNQDVMWWYRQNIFFFVKADKLANYPNLAAATQNDKQVRTLIHPKLYEHIKAELNEYNGLVIHYKKVVKSSYLILKQLAKNIFRRNS